MKNIVIVLALSLAANLAHSQTSASAQQESNSAATSFGSMTFSQTPEHTSSTINNVSAPILGAYASSFSQFNCGQTTQGGFAVAGFSGAFGSSKDQKSCVLEVAAAELARQSTIDARNATKLQDAAIQIRCRINKEVYEAMKDAGFDCKKKPDELISRTDDQPPSLRVAGSGN